MQIPYPPTERPKTFQLEAATWALSRESGKSYIVLPPGSGKTIVAALIANKIPAPCFYVCPPFLTKNVNFEFARWKTSDTPLHLFPSSQLHKKKFLYEFERLLKYYGKGFLIGDEGHQFKNYKSLRTKAFFDCYARKFHRVVMMSGTPMPTARPMELYPAVSHLAPESINHMNFFKFGMRYCSGYKGEWGWDFTGSSNFEEFSSKIREKFMYKREKADILPELPPKTEEFVFIDGKTPPQVERMEKNLLKVHSPTDIMKGIIGAEHVATYRKLLGEAKVDFAVKYIRYLLEEGDENILVFGIHKSVLATLALALSKYKPLIITGATPTARRFDIQQEYMSNPQRRLMLLNIQAGGVGLNLQKATKVVFVEASWVPGENEQASDRAHRIGTKGNVLVQYLVFTNSIDASVMRANLERRERLIKL